MFKDCVSDLEKNKYKRSRELQNEVDEWLKIYQPDFYKKQRTGSYNDVFDAICELVNIPKPQGAFLHFIDYRFLFDTTRGYRFENLTPNFGKILQSGLEALKYDCADGQFEKDYNRTIDAIISLAERISKAMKESGSEKLADCFAKLQTKPADSFFDGLQRILFIDQLFWQMGHRLIGLGRLDMLLFDLYHTDLQSGILTAESAKKYLSEFMLSLHDYYWLKSNVLMGDTGQIIILGGLDESGNYRCNELTYLFIEVLKELQIPDPKLLLRVSKDMPKDLMGLALGCMQTGVGSPILSNDDVVIPKLLDFGVDCIDAYQYGTSACWEPLIPGKSMSANNMAYLSYPAVLQRVWDTKNIGEIHNFEDWMNCFYEALKDEMEIILHKIDAFRFQYNPLLSVFLDSCKEKKMDVSVGGAKYSNYGITTVGLSNAINAILNIKEMVFGTKEFSLSDVKVVLDSDFANEENLQKRLKKSGKKYGKDQKEIVDFTNEIIKKTTALCCDYTNYLGGKLKFGLSAPTYIDAAEHFPATFDGRKKGEPFGVHISTDESNGYTEILNFASQLDYQENRFNGNVVDFMVSPDFLEKHFEKMTDFLFVGIEIGFFQLQMNVIGSDILIDAKNNPDKYLNLIVRVWGFSAYFRELPDSYQDLLIKRALKNEGKL